MTPDWLQEQRVECFSLLAAASCLQDTGAGHYSAGQLRRRDRDFAEARRNMAKVRTLLVSVVRRCGGWDMVPAWHDDAISQDVGIETAICDVLYGTEQPKPPEQEENADGRAV